MSASDADSYLVVGRELGKGSFSEVFEATCSRSNANVAVKFARGKDGAILLRTECEVMKQLAHCKCKIKTGIPYIVDTSHVPDYLVMEQVGQTLLALKTERSNWSLKTIVMVAIKAISALEEIHSCGFLHRDIKPDNIAVALNPVDPRIFLIDLGLSSRYLVNGLHVGYSEKSKFQGTPYFCSRNSLMGLKPSRRDDIEALGYVLIFLCKGSLPWFETSPTWTDFVTSILEIRDNCSISMLCKGLEPEFGELLKYSRGLGFTEKPNYEMLRAKFQRLVQRAGFQLDWKYDWVPKHVRMHKSESVRIPKEASSRRLRSATSKRRLFINSSKSLKESSTVARLQLPPQPVMTSQSTGDNTSSEDATPVHRVDQLPAFRWPRKPSSEAVETIESEFIASPTTFRHKSYAQ